MSTMRLFGLAAFVGLALGRVHVVELKHRPYSPEEEVEVLSLLQTSESTAVADGGDALGESADLETDAESESESKPSGRLPLVQLNSRFYGEIGIGSPPQNEEVIWDTGSDVAWVYHKECQHCPHRMKFDPSASSSLVDRNRHFTITYGTGATEGPSVVDKVAMGDLEVQKQIIGLAQDVDPMLERFPFSGVIGMSYPMENEPAGFVPIFDQIMQEKALDRHTIGNLERGDDAEAGRLHPQFSFFLSKQPSRWASYLFLGATKEMLEADDISWVDAERKNQYWEVGFNGIHLKYPDGRMEQITDCKPCSGGSCSNAHSDWAGRCLTSIDTGHSLISGPPEFVNGFKDRVTPQDGSCASTEGMPDMVFDFAGNHLTMKPSDYLVKMAGKCVPGVRERPPRNGHDYVFGEHFLRSFYTIFDREKDRVGFSQSSELSEGGGLGVEHITDQYQPQGSGGFERRQGRRRGRAHRSERSEALQEAEELEAQPRKTLRAAMEAVLQPGEKEDATRR